MKHDKLYELLRLKSTGEITPEQRLELEELIRTDEEACRQYLDYTTVDAMLQWQFDETTVPVIPKKPKVITFGRVLMAAAALLVLGLGIHFWPTVEPKGPKGEEFPVLVESQYGKPHTLEGWSFLPALDTDYEILGPARVRLGHGEVYAASTPYPQGQRPHLEIETPAGNVTAKGTRFYVSASKKEKEEEMKITRVLVMTGIVGLSNIFGSAEAQEGEQLLATSKTAPQKLMLEGNYREALDIYEKLAVDPAHKGEAAARDLHAALVCMKKLGRIDFWDELAEKAVVAHPKDWRVLWQVAMGYYGAGSWGHMVDGSYQRGDRIRGSRRVNAYERDRIRSLQLMQQAMSHIPEGADPIAAGRFYEDFSKVLISGGGTGRMQMLTDLSELPDHDAPGHSGRNSLAPVDEDNRPVLYKSPKSWKDAGNDGERWRILMRRAAEANPARKLAIDLHYANFLRHQFGVQTLGERVRHAKEDQPDGGLYSLHTLKDNETLARLATGVQRLELDSDTNFIQAYRDIAGVEVALPDRPIRDLTYKYYEGDWDELPDFAKLTPKSSGLLKKGVIDCTISPREDYYGMVFEGQLPIPEDGEYTFSLHSDDGAKLTLGNDFILDNDGLHSADTGKTGKVKLKKGFVPLRLVFFEKSGDQDLSLRWSGPGFENRPLSETRAIPPQEAALTALAEIFENRRQLPKAAEAWAESIERFGPGEEGFKGKRLAQIIDNWGRLEKQGMHVAGRKARVDFSFRNAKEAHFIAHKVKLNLWLKEVKDHLISEPDRLDQYLLGFKYIGGRLIWKNDKTLLGEKVAEWDVKLEPKAGHRDAQIKVETPLEEAGLYLLEAHVGKGNVTRVMVWITKAVIIQRPVNNSQLYFLADAITGKPIPNATLEFVGYDNVYDRKTRSHHYRAKNFAEKTDASGMVIPRHDGFESRYRWLVTATNSEGLLAAHGFITNIHSEFRNYEAAKAYVVTDRPVYRPGQDVKFSAWVRQARYDLEDISRYAARDFMVRLTGPRGKTLFDRKVTTGTYGEFHEDWALPEDALLGRYQLRVWAKNFTDPIWGQKRREYKLGSLDFWVEEYKKTEYEVTVDAPTEPVVLGDAIEAVIAANYYFGGPVTDAKVTFKVRRQRHQSSWSPPRTWDWLYGPGYWWFSEDYDWYPGWKEWGRTPPGRSESGPKEVVQEQTVAIGPDGKVKVRIDTAVAKALYGDSDHRYEITAEVVDASRRTIVGKGSVIAARQPFKVHAWLNGGHFEVGDEIVANFMGRTPDGKPVLGKGVATLYKVRYNDKKEPVEEKVKEWKLDPSEDGTVQLSVHAHQSGQYRLAYTLTDAKGRQREGAVLVPIRGEGFDGSGFRFNDLEVVLDKAEYAPGERAKVMVSTAHKGSTVALLIRPNEGNPPIIVNQKGSSSVHDIEITAKDHPNIFVEAFTVREGKVYKVTRKIAVPPAKRILSVELEPTKKRYKPSEKGAIEIRLKDNEGKPFKGHAVVTIYDKSLEYVSSHLPPDIHAFFWKWQREPSRWRSSFHVDLVSLNKSFEQLLREGEVGMAPIGKYKRTAFFGYGGYARGRLFRSAASLSASDDMYASFNSSSGFGVENRASLSESSMDKSLYLSKLSEASSLEKKSVRDAVELADARIRSDFTDTAFWKADIETDEQGYAGIEVPMPDNLTTWKVKVWAMGHGTVVGQGETEVITSKDLLVRLQAPRFFVEKDEVTLSAVVHNNLGGSRKVKVSLELEGDHLAAKDLVKEVSIEAGADKRVDWVAKVQKEGQVTVRMKAQTTDDADAMEMSFPVYVHGALRTESWSGVLRPGEKQGIISLEVPKERRPEQSNLEIRYSPSIALAMVDALPYLANYPHKNCESVINRFVPVVLTQKILKDLGVDLGSIAKKATNLNPQEIGDAGERAKQRNGRNRNPIFEGDKVNRMAKTGLADLTKMQNADGGWSWTPGGDSDPYMTALVVSNLKLARDNGLTLVPKMLERGIKFLETHQKGQVERIRNAPAREKPYKLSADNLDAFVFEVLARTGKVNKEMQEYLYRDRLKLSRYSQALLALGLDHAGAEEQRNMVVRNLSQFLVRDEENQTAYLDLPQNRFWWRWYDNEIETQAAYLKLLVSLDPKGEVTSGLAKYLINNRKHATYWNSTRDTAFCLEALADFVRASGEIEPNMTVEVLINGQAKQEIVITPDNLFTFDNLVRLTGESVKTGKHEVVIRRKGTGPLYYNAYLTTFSLEDELKASGLELKVKRNHYRLVPQDHRINSTGSRGQLVSQRVDHFKRVKLKHGETVKSGDLVEVELVVDSKNDYEYLLFEDYKPAGFEAVELRSGHRWNGLGAYTEFRDEKVTFQVRSLSRGRHTLRYRIRAEVPGSFSALPTQVNGVYAPELKANSDEIRLKVESD